MKHLGLNVEIWMGQTKNSMFQTGPFTFSRDIRASIDQWQIQTSAKLWSKQQEKGAKNETATYDKSGPRDTVCKEDVCRT